MIRSIPCMRGGLLALLCGVLLCGVLSSWPRASIAREVLVTVDDLPMVGDPLPFAERKAATEQMLKTLAAYRIQAIGFVTWSRRQGPEDDALIQMWLDAGHLLGNHSDQHKSYTHTDQAAWLADVERGRAQLAQLTGQPVRWFRFPHLRQGNTRAKLDAARAWLKRTGQRNVPVTLDLQDWQFEGPWQAAKTTREQEQVAQRYQAEMRQIIRAQLKLSDKITGDPDTPQVLLLHAMSVSASQWPHLFYWLDRQGLRFAPADRVLKHSAFADPPDYVGPYGFSLWHRLAALKSNAHARTEVENLLKTQAEAWNRGDLEAFCSVYAEDALFISPSGLTRGRGQVLARYKKRYPTQAKMGQLSLEVEEIRVAQGTEFTLVKGARPSRVHGLSVAAKWKLAYPGKPAAEGHTLIVFRRGPDGWLIVQDASM